MPAGWVTVVLTGGLSSGAVWLRLALLACVALGFFGLGFEASHGVHALYEHWYCATPFVVIGIGVLLGVFDVRRSRIA